MPTISPTPASGKGAKTEPPRHLRAADEVEQQELVDRFHRGSLRCCGSCGGQLGLEGVARNRRSFEHAARIVREQAELLVERSCDGRWNFDAAERDAACSVAVAVTGERTHKLLEIERIAAALVVENRGGVADELPSFECGQRAELDPR